MSGQGPPRIASRHILKKLFSYSIARLGELGGGKERARERESLHKVLKEIVASSMARQLWLCLAPHTHTQTHTHTPSRAQSKSSQPRRHSQIYKSFARCSFCLCQLAVALCLSLVAFCYVCDYLHAVMPVIGGMLYDVSCDWLHAVRCYICDWGHAVMPVIGGMPLCLWLAACFMPVIGCMLCDISCVKYNA
jgi:hypothetical protein